MNSTNYNENKEYKINIFFNDHLYVFSLLLIIIILFAAFTHILCHYLCFVYLKKENKEKTGMIEMIEMIEIKKDDYILI